MIHRAVEEALDLGGMEVDRHQSVGTGRLEQIGHQPRRDRLAAPVLLVLAGVSVEGDDHGDAFGRCALERIDHDQLLHDPRVDRRGVALQDERVRPTNRLPETNEDLTVGEVVGQCRRQSDAEFGGDGLGEFEMRSAAEKHETLLRGYGLFGHSFLPNGIL